MGFLLSFDKANVKIKSMALLKRNITMQKYALPILTLALLSIGFANATPTSQDNPPAFHGCLSKTTNVNRSPEGSSQLCLTDNNKFLIYGFGFIRVGTYQVDSENKRIQLSFINPKELYIYSTYDPTIKGTHIQFDGFTDSQTSRTFAQFNHQSLYPIFNKNPNCIKYPNIHQPKDTIKDLTLYIQDSNHQTDIRQFNIPLSKKQNKLYIRYIDKSNQFDDGYLSYRLVGKNYQFFDTYSKVIDGVRHFHITDNTYRLTAFNENDEILELLAYGKALPTTEQENEVVYFNEHFDEQTIDPNDFPYELDNKTNSYHLKYEKKLELFKQEMMEMGYSEQGFDELIKEMPKSELQEQLNTSSLYLEKEYQPILWQYQHHTPNIINLTNFPNKIDNKPLFVAECDFNW